MNRFKLVSVLLFLTVVGILLGQNRQLLSLKFFCPDVASQSCLYRTSSLPLAAWIGLFAIAGIISSLWWQFLNQLATPVKNNSNSKKSDNRRSAKERFRDRESDDTRKQAEVKAKKNPTTDWEQPVSEDWESNETIKKTQDRFQKAPKIDLGKNEPRDSTRTDRAYSQKLKEPDLQNSENSVDRSKQTTRKNSIDDVYDANYRTVSSPQQTASNSYEDDEEEWI